ncbi:MAG: hypothetical protein Q8858_15610, partial [Bacteroidota bacterium]|nr:hypothetical protein [Bacteroidota bacterium]
MKSFLLQSVLIIAAMIALAGNDSNAQWVRMKGPYGWEFNQFSAGNSIILAGGPSHGIYRSTDNGLHWLEANSGITNTDITSLGLYKQNFLAGVWDGTNTLLYLSTDNANSWAQVNTISPKQSITSFAVKDSIIFLGTYGDGIYSSIDGGFHWKRPANLSLEHPVVSLLVNDKNLYAGTWGGAVYRS